MFYKLTAESGSDTCSQFLPQHKVRGEVCYTSSHALSLPLLHGGPVEHVPHARRLLLEELAVLGALLGPGGVERRGVLVHQVGVLGASRPTKVFDLRREKVNQMQNKTFQNLFMFNKKRWQLTCMTLGKMVLLKWSSRVGALKSLLYTSSSSSCNRNHV